MTSPVPAPVTATPDERWHCWEHREYDPSCTTCVLAKMKAEGIKVCGHDSESCNGHGDF